MPYRLATARSDYRDLASGFVLRSAPGYPALAFLGRIRDLRAAW
jgi:hypothetical protein